MNSNRIPEKINRMFPSLGDTIYNEMKMPLSATKNLVLDLTVWNVRFEQYSESFMKWLNSTDHSIIVDTLEVIEAMSEQVTFNRLEDNFSDLLVNYLSYEIDYLYDALAKSDKEFDRTTVINAYRSEEGRVEGRKELVSAAAAPILMDGFL